MAKKEIRLPDETAELRQELQDTAQALRCAYERFNFVSDQELVESCVYEISALKAKYNYLLRRAKELGEDEPPYMAASGMKGGQICQS